MNARQTQTRAAAGFTLLEVMLAVGLMGILIGGIFSVQRGALMITRNVMEQQEESMRMSSFAELMRRNFEQAPGNCRINLVLPRGGDGVSEVYFKDYPLAFAWSGISAGSKGVVLRLERNKARNFSAVILYLDDEAVKSYEAGSLNEREVNRETGKLRVQRLELMTGIKEMLWKVIDDTVATNSGAPDGSEDWLTEWPLEKTKRPTRVRFYLTMVDSGDPLSLIFWVPSMVPPEQFANGSAGGGNGNLNGGKPNGGIPVGPLPGPGKGNPGVKPAPGPGGGRGGR